MSQYSSRTPAAEIFVASSSRSSSNGRRDRRSRRTRATIAGISCLDRGTAARGRPRSRRSPRRRFGRGEQRLARDSSRVEESNACQDVASRSSTRADDPKIVIRVPFSAARGGDTTSTPVDHVHRRIPWRIATRAESNSSAVISRRSRAGHDPASSSPSRDRYSRRIAALRLDR